MTNIKDLIIEEEKRACSPPLGYPEDNPRKPQSRVKPHIGHRLHPKIDPKLGRTEIKDDN